MTMASSSVHYYSLLLSLSLFSVFCLSALSSHEPQLHLNRILAFIYIDPQTNLFGSSMSMGKDPINFMPVTIDLGGPSIWYQCDSNYNSSSYRPVPCDSQKCPPSSPCSTCFGDYKPGCSNKTCGLTIINPLTSHIFTGDLGNDDFFINTGHVPGLLSACSSNNDTLLQGLSEDDKGIIGLSKSPISLPSQLSFFYNLPPIFSICFPSSTIIEIGGGTMYFGSGDPSSLSQFLVTTPLITNPVNTAPIYEGDPSYDYFIQVLSINVDGKVVNFKPSLLSFDKKGNGGSKISTMHNFTRLHRKIFKPLVRDFMKKASDRKMKKVGSVAPFEACFDEQSIGNTSTGFLDVPVVELIVEGGVGWRIYGSNSMVKVKENVMCLGFVNGGKTPKGTRGSPGIVIGRHQLEDNLLEFDLASAKLSFSSSLLVHNSSCNPHLRGSSVSSF